MSDLRRLPRDPLTGLRFGLRVLEQGSPLWNTRFRDDIAPALLRARELPPFVAAIEAGTKSIMTAHIRVPALTGDAPATFSRGQYSAPSSDAPTIAAVLLA